MRVRVRGDVGDAIALPDTHRLQDRRPVITALEELSVRQPQFAVDDGFPVGVKPARATRKLHRSEEHTSELQSHSDLVCRLLLEKKKKLSDINDHESNSLYTTMRQYFVHIL